MHLRFTDIFLNLECNAIDLFNGENTMPQKCDGVVYSPMLNDSNTDALAAVALVLGSAFGTMLIGYMVARVGMLSTEARLGVSTLYAKLVFPTMVFKGVAAIDIWAVDPSVATVAITSKILVAVMVICLSLTVRSNSTDFEDINSAGLANAAALAMAASHSFDVTFGVPLAKVLFWPEAVSYVFLNQSLQLVILNPVLLFLMELGQAKRSSSGNSSSQSSTNAIVRKTIGGVAMNPLVLMTLAGLVAGQAFPAGLPPPLLALVKLVSDAGPFLGFLSLGFALTKLGGTSREEFGVAAALCAFKLVVMPLVYVSISDVIGCTLDPAFLQFLGTLPASASVYSLCLSRDLSPRVVGPLVPASMLLCAALSLLPLLQPSESGYFGFGAVGLVRALIAIGGVTGIIMSSVKHASGRKEE